MRRNSSEKRQVAEDILKACRYDDVNKVSSSEMLDKLLANLENEDNFLTED